MTAAAVVREADKEAAVEATTLFSEGVTEEVGATTGSAGAAGRGTAKAEVKEEEEEEELKEGAGRAEVDEGRSRGGRAGAVACTAPLKLLKKRVSDPAHSPNAL